MSFVVVSESNIQKNNQPAPLSQFWLKKYGVSSLCSTSKSSNDTRMYVLKLHRVAYVLLIFTLNIDNITIVCVMFECCMTDTNKVYEQHVAGIHNGEKKYRIRANNIKTIIKLFKSWHTYMY